MTEITAATIKKLREASGAGMMDCKKALAENNGDFDAAVDWLRTKGLAAAAKKAGRVAAEGLVAVTSSGKHGALVEVNAETDFVAKNDVFQKLVREIGELALGTKGDLDALKSAQTSNGKSVEEDIKEHVGTIGENLQLRRADYLEVNEGLVAKYLHNAYADGLGKIGVIVALESSAPAEKLEEVGKQIAMHIAAAKPESLNTESLDQSIVQRERDIFTEQARASGKPDNIIEKMIEGRIRKFYEEVVLLEQAFVIDGKTKVSAFLEQQGNEAGAPITIKGFVRFNLGEGIEKEEEDFAAEVAATAAGAA